MFVVQNVVDFCLDATIKLNKETLERDMALNDAQLEHVKTLLESDDVSALEGIVGVLRACASESELFVTLQSIGAEPLPENWGPRGTLVDPMYFLKRVFSASSSPIQHYLAAWTWGFLHGLDATKVAVKTGLNLEATGIPAVPETIGNLVNLKRLYLADNQLTVIPDSIGQLQSLRVLDLRHNSLETLPPSIANLNSLEDLWVAENKFTDAELDNIRTLVPPYCTVSLW